MRGICQLLSSRNGDIVAVGIVVREGAQVRLETKKVGSEGLVNLSASQRKFHYFT